MAAYLLNMAVRLLAMRRALKPTGSIYLHCDPTASHYLKIMMDAIFGKQNFQNEFIWYYSGGGASKRRWARKHDTLLFYTKTDKHIFNVDVVRVPHKWDEGQLRADGTSRDYDKGKLPDDVFQHHSLLPWSEEHLGYPTQKPLALLERIIMASSPPDGLVLDPFCGCGTAVHAAEKLGRRWVGVDISTFAAGLMRERILRNFPTLTTDDVLVRGVPVNIVDAVALARKDKFEFEKWVCGAIGAEGMFHEPGTKGADGGVDGVLTFYPIRFGRKVVPEHAIIQVKGGNVTPDAIRALKTTVDHFGATAGVMVCFGNRMQTVENQRSKATFDDDMDAYPVIQGFSVEELLEGKRLNLPPYGLRRRSKQIGDQPELSV